MAEPILRPLLDDSHIITDPATVDAEIEGLGASGDVFRRAATMALDAVERRWDGASQRALGQTAQTEAHEAMAQALCQEFGWQPLSDLDGGNLDRVISPDGGVQIATLTGPPSVGIAIRCPRTNLKKTAGRLWEEIARCDPEWTTDAPEFPFLPHLSLELFLVHVDRERGLVRAELARPKYQESDAYREVIKSWIRRRILIDEQWAGTDAQLVTERGEATYATQPDIPITERHRQ